MGRTNKSRRTPNVKPITKIELSEEKIGLRLALLILFLVIAASAFTYAFNSLFTGQEGWTTIEADSASDINCSSEFTFNYNLGVNGVSPNVEKKAMVTIYTEATEKAFQLFHNNQEFENVNNVFYINKHPNEVIQVDEVLYDAFAMIQEYGNRSLYLAPVYTQYRDIFYCNDDSELVNFDPYLNEEVAAYYQEVATFANDENAVNIELLDNNEVILHVSEEYLLFAEENCISEYIDFSWMKNAFIVDYLAETMISGGYTSGMIASYDGFERNLDDTDNLYSFNLYDRIENVLYPAGVMEYEGANSIVFLRDYKMAQLDNNHYYELDNGEIRTSYLDVKDGLCKNSVHNLYGYSREKGCAEVLMNLIPVYISDSFDNSQLLNASEKGIYSIYMNENVIYYNDDSIKIAELYTDDNITYTIQYQNH